MREGGGGREEGREGRGEGESLEVTAQLTPQPTAARELDFSELAGPLKTALEDYRKVLAEKRRSAAKFKAAKLKIEEKENGESAAAAASDALPSTVVSLGFR